MYDTGRISNYLEHCEDIEDFKNILLPKLQDQRIMWQQKIEQILRQGGYSVRQFAALCRVSEPAVRKWRNGSLPQSRDMFLRIGFAAGYNVEEMNVFLRRYGRCPQLYVKSLEDSVCMFVLRSPTLPHTYECYLRVLDYIKGELQTGGYAQPFAYGTRRMSEHFASLVSMDELVEFARSNAGSYREAYARLYNYVLAFLRINLYDIGDDMHASFHAMASESKWSSSLRHCISEIRSRRWFPLRHKIISLGLHLNMDLDDVNKMLQYAQMEPLYPKNPVEAAVIFALEEARLNELIFRDGSDDLCQYVKSVLQQLHLADSEYLIDDL